MEKFKYIFSSLIFNIAETILIFLIGKLLCLPTNSIIIIMLCFMLSRGCFGKALHFKTWYRCLVWSSLILLSLFLILKVDLVISILFTIFAAFIMTGKSNINDIYLWSGKSSKYDALKEFISFSPNNSIILEHEEYWRKNYIMRYKIFKLYFRDNKSYEEIKQIEDLPDNTIIKKRMCNNLFNFRKTFEFASN